MLDIEEKQADNNYVTIKDPGRSKCSGPDQ